MDVGALLDLLLDAVLLGWAATAVFCGLAGVAVALWGGIRWPLGLLAGVVLLYLGLLVVLVVAVVRVQARVRASRAARAAAVPGAVPALPAATPAPLAADPASAPAPFAADPAVVPAPVTASTPVVAGATATATGPRRVHAPVPAGPGARLALRRGWVRWTRTPPTRTEYAVAALALVLAVALVGVTQVTWVKLTALGFGVVSVGAFEIQLGLFAVLAGVAALVVAVGVLRLRSAWWPVLLAWFGSWWLFVALEVLHASGGALDDLNRLVGDQVRERFRVEARPELQLGVGWSAMVGLAAAMMVLAVVLLVLQGRRGAHYRLDGRA